MYEIGDKIVYPMHGAGHVEDKVVLDLFDDGDEKEYYKLKIGTENMDIYVPIENAEKVGLRPIATPEVIDEMIQSLHGEIGKMSKNWNKRYQSNMEILKSGDIFDVAKVVKNLTLLNRSKGLSTGEKKMMTNARNFLVSEVVLSKQVNKEKALKMINNAIGED